MASLAARTAYQPYFNMPSTSACPVIPGPLLRQHCIVKRSCESSPPALPWPSLPGALAGIALGFLQPPAVGAQQKEQGRAGCLQQSYTHGRSSVRGRDCGARHTIFIACIVVVNRRGRNWALSFFSSRGGGQGPGWPALTDQHHMRLGASCLEGDGGVLQAGGGQQVESGGVAQGAPCSHIHKGEACTQGGWVGGRAGGQLMGWVGGGMAKGADAARSAAIQQPAFRPVHHTHTHTHSAAPPATLSTHPHAQLPPRTQAPLAGSLVLSTKEASSARMSPACAWVCPFCSGMPALAREARWKGRNTKRPRASAPKVQPAAGGGDGARGGLSNWMADCILHSL